jgi:hypothetical protein
MCSTPRWGCCCWCCNRWWGLVGFCVACFLQGHGRRGQALPSATTLAHIGRRVRLHDVIATQRTIALLLPPRHEAGLVKNVAARKLEGRVWGKGGVENGVQLPIFVDFLLCGRKKALGDLLAQLVGCAEVAHFPEHTVKGTPQVPHHQEGHAVVHEQHGEVADKDAQLDKVHHQFACHEVHALVVPLYAGCVFNAAGYSEQCVPIHCQNQGKGQHYNLKQEQNKHCGASLHEFDSKQACCDHIRHSEHCSEPQEAEVPQGTVAGVSVSRRLLQLNLLCVALILQTCGFGSRTDSAGGGRQLTFSTRVSRRM